VANVLRHQETSKTFNSSRALELASGPIGFARLAQPDARNSHALPSSESPQYIYHLPRRRIPHNRPKGTVILMRLFA